MGMENVVIAYRADITQAKRQVKLLDRQNKVLAQNLGKDFVKGSTIVRQELTKISTTAKSIKLPLGGATNQLRTYETVVKSANGKLKTITQSIAGYGKNQKITNQTIRNGATVTRTLGQNFATLAKRALLTIPLWFAIRQGLGFVVRTLKEGITNLVAFDKALQKARRNLQGTASEMEANFATLRKEVTKLSIETGKSTEDITNAFQKFATVGFDFETSMSGANNATKLSILLFGDADETATAFARSMRVLIDESKNAKPASEQLASVMTLTSELWKTNAFELNELTQSLTRFAPVAKTAGFSADEAVKLMAGLSTAGLRGSKAGRLLSTSLTRLLTKTDKLASSLGVKVNPEVDRTYDVFLRVLDALQKTRSETGKLSPEFEKITKDIFGLRSGLAVKGLIALRNNLQAVLGVTGDIGKFNDEFEDVNKTLFQLVARFHNLNKETGKAFVSGLVGGEDFRESLEKIVALQTKIQKGAEIFGRIIGGAGWNFAGEFDRLTKEAGEVFYDMFNDIEDYSAEAFSRITKGIRGQLKKAEIEKLIVDIVSGKVEIPEGSVIAVRSALRKRLSEFDVEPEVDVNYKLDGIDLGMEDQTKLIDALIKDQIERTKLAGATAVQQLKINDALRQEYDVTDDVLAQKTRQLEIERAITQEQNDRIQFSSESVKLAEVAKNHGIKTAQAIGEVLDNQRDYNTFIKQGGERAKILKDTFKDFAKNKELENFFKGVKTPGQDFVRGGERIPISELGDRGSTPIRARTQFDLAKSRLGISSKEQTTPVVSTNHKVTIDLNINGKNFSIGAESSEEFIKIMSDIEPRVTYIFKEEIERVFDDIANRGQKTTSKKFREGVEGT